MGSKKTKTESTQAQQTHVTTTPNNPQWVTDGLGGVGGNLTKLGSADPYSFVAGPDPLQTQAGTAAGNLTTSPLYGDAASLFKQAGGAGPNGYTAAQVGDNPQVQSASLLDNLGSYMSPYTNDVVNSTLAGFDKSAGYSRAGDALARAGDSTFGGSGGSIQTALNEQNIRQDRAQTEAQLRDQAFNTGASLSGQDATRRQSASSDNASNTLQRLLANMGADNTARQYSAGAADTAANRQLSAGTSLAGLGAQQGADARANVDTQSQIGAMLQALAQQHAGAPLAFNQGLVDMWHNLPTGQLNGSTSDGTMSGTSTGTTKESGASTADWLNYFAANAQAAAAAGSDRRLKRDIVKMGERPDGIGVYSFRYKADGPHGRMCIGAMADEVLKVKPEAVTVMPSGYLGVYYGML